MEKAVKARKWCMLVLTICSPWVQADCVPLTFQSPLCVSWYKKSIDSCMQAWHAADVLQQNNSNIISEDECTIHINVLMGQLAFAAFCLENCVYAGLSIVVDDISYLMQIVDRITKQCATLVPICSEHVPCAEHTLQTIMQQLHKLYDLQ